MKIGMGIHGEHGVSISVTHLDRELSDLLSRLCDTAFSSGQLIRLWWLADAFVPGVTNCRNGCLEHASKADALISGKRHRQPISNSLAILSKVLKMNFNRPYDG
ncbi:dihydroxyacetone kinase subunit DhaK [Brucella sp. 2716]|uniref:dihydroxyacetone kinase subunit DhaK n=1 Tax=Brucella sp. 2716 TaxID=2975052 RepID=UPI00217D202E|nr:dihydroxyacetone kinase subunit DhaK [Brucella sp. 2716]UWF58484.1 dihydroxyacetone kinase subunit DhaK [Brucella sp. 2716]